MAVTYEITAPNGKTYNVEGPEGATDEQVRAEVLRQFPDSLGTLKQYPDTVRTPAPQPAPQSTGQQLLAGTQSDLAGMAQGAAGVFDFPMEVANTVQRGVNYGLGRVGGGLADLVGAHGVADHIRTAADKADTTLANLPSVSDTIEQVSPTPQGLEGSRFLSQLVGGAMVPLGPKGAKPVKAPNLTPEAAAAKGTAADVIAAGEQNNVRVLTSDVRPPKTFMGKMAQATGERIPYAGTGAVRAKQQAERVAAVKDLATEYGADAANNYLDEVASDLSKTRALRLSTLANQKKAVIQGIAAPFAQAPETVKAIDAQIAKLSGINAEKFAPVIKELEQFKANITSGKTLEQVEGNRKLLGGMFEDPSLAGIKDDGQKAINAIYAPLRNDMGAFIRQNAGDGAYSRWKSANDELSTMAGELDSSAFRNVLKNAETTPEQVGNLIFSKKPSDVRRLTTNLSPAGQQKVRSAIIQQAFEKAGGEEVSPDKFATQLGALGSRIGVAFDGADLARVEGLQRLLQATKRASVAAAAPPTGVQNAPIIGGYAAGSALGWWALPAGALGGVLARLYEAPATRNWLVGLSKSKAGSPQESRFLERLTAAATAQAEIHSKTLNSAANDSVGAPVAAGDTQENQTQQQPPLQP